MSSISWKIFVLIQEMDFSGESPKKHGVFQQPGSFWIIQFCFFNWFDHIHLSVKKSLISQTHLSNFVSSLVTFLYSWYNPPQCSAVTSPTLSRPASSSFPARAGALPSAVGKHLSLIRAMAGNLRCMPSEGRKGWYSKSRPRFAACF